MRLMTPNAITVNLADVVAILRQKMGGVEKIILFGSQARGEADEMSDLDLIVIQKTEKGFVDRLASVPLLPVHADVFVYTPAEFELMREHENPFIMSALEHAKIIYPSDEKL